MPCSLLVVACRRPGLKSSVAVASNFWTWMESHLNWWVAVEVSWSSMVVVGHPLKLMSRVAEGAALSLSTGVVEVPER